MKRAIIFTIVTHACIRTSAIDAYQRDFQVIIVRDCVASKDLKHHEITLDYLDGGVATVTTLAVNSLNDSESKLLYNKTDGRMPDTGALLSCTFEHTQIWTENLIASSSRACRDREKPLFPKGLENNCGCLS